MNIPAQLQKAQTKQNKKSTPSQLTKKKEAVTPQRQYPVAFFKILFFV